MRGSWLGKPPRVLLYQMLARLFTPAARGPPGFGFFSWSLYRVPLLFSTKHSKYAHARQHARQLPIIAYLNACEVDFSCILMVTNCLPRRSQKRALDSPSKAAEG